MVTMNDSAIYVGLGDAGPVDSDGDGVPDDQDPFPDDPTESADGDGDGVGDNGDAFPNDPSEWADSDGDGVGNNADAFPDDPAESADSDGDAVGDNGDAFPNDPAESADSDGDGVGNNADAFPNSNSQPTVVVRACATPVGNQVLANGATFNDLVALAISGARNQGALVSAVTQLANTWKAAGLISGRDHALITACAAQSK
jgi:hypothetical protein